MFIDSKIFIIHDFPCNLDSFKAPLYKHFLQSVLMLKISTNANIMKTH